MDNLCRCMRLYAKKKSPADKLRGSESALFHYFPGQGKMRCFFSRKALSAISAMGVSLRESE